MGKKKNFFGIEDQSIIYIKLIFGFVLVVLIAWNIFDQVQRYKTRKSYCSSYREMAIHGIVVEKYNDNETSDEPVVVILENGWNKIKYQGACTRSIEKLMVSDSVCKSQGEKNFRIFRRGSEVAFECCNSD